MTKNCHLKIIYNKLELKPIGSMMPTIGCFADKKILKKQKKIKQKQSKYWY